MDHPTQRSKDPRAKSQVEGYPDSDDDAENNEDVLEDGARSLLVGHPRRFDPENESWPPVYVIEPHVAGDSVGVRQRNRHATIQRRGHDRRSITTLENIDRNAQLGLIAKRIDERGVQQSAQMEAPRAGPSSLLVSMGRQAARNVPS